MYQHKHELWSKSILWLPWITWPHYKGLPRLEVLEEGAKEVKTEAM
jgi:hypothetical protein